MAEETKQKTVKAKDVLSKDDAKPAKKVASKSAEKTETKPAAKKEEKKKTRYRHTHIEHHSDGSHTVRHVPTEGGEEMSYSKPDLDGVHDGLEEHVGDANEGEEMAAAGGAEPAPQPGAAPVPQEA